MSEPTNTAPAPAPQFSGDLLADAPGGDALFSDLFPTDQGIPPTTGEPTTPASPAPQAAPSPAAPTPQSAPDYFLRNADGTVVYKTQEEAVRGLEHKDAIIQQLRERYILERGVDPLTNQPIRLPDTSQGPQVPASYTQNQRQFLQDLVQAADKADGDAYFRTHAKLVYDLLSPLAPVIAGFAKQQAVEQLGQQFTDFRGFLQSPVYAQVLRDAPDLKQAIEIAESDPMLAQRLPQLYGLAYRAGQGYRVSELLEKAKTANPTQPGRPTTESRTATPPTPAGPGVTSIAEALGTSEGRKAIIEQFESQGLQNRPII